MWAFSSIAHIWNVDQLDILTSEWLFAALTSLDTISFSSSWIPQWAILVSRAPNNQWLSFSIDPSHSPSSSDYALLQFVKLIIESGSCVDWHCVAAPIMFRDDNNRQSLSGSPNQFSLLHIPSQWAAGCATQNCIRLYLCSCLTSRHDSAPQCCKKSQEVQEFWATQPFLWPRPRASKAIAAYKEKAALPMHIHTVGRQAVGHWDSGCQFDIRVFWLEALLARATWRVLHV